MLNSGDRVRLEYLNSEISSFRPNDRVEAIDSSYEEQLVLIDLKKQIASLKSRQLALVSDSRHAKEQLSKDAVNSSLVSMRIDIALAKARAVFV